MSSPTVSYILLTYNQVATVAEAVRSALAQDCPSMEIVITDDCSSDETFEVVRETVEGYDGPHKIILNRNRQNLGLAANVDKAHQLSSGEVIIAAAGDDVSLPHRTRRIVHEFESGQPLLVCSYAQVIDPDGNIVPGDFRTATFYHTTDLAKVARSKSLYIGATGAWHRSLYDRYGPLDPDTYEDLVMGFRAALEGKIGVIEEELVKYRLGQGLTSSDRYFADVATFRSRRLKGFRANRAIMQQRLKDASTFGIAEDSKVAAILRKEVLRAELGISYYGETSREFLLQSLAHPLLCLHTWYSERRRARKMQRLIDSREQPGVG